MCCKYKGLDKLGFYKEKDVCNYYTEKKANNELNIDCAPIHECLEELCPIRHPDILTKYIDKN